MPIPAADQPVQDDGTATGLLPLSADTVQTLYNQSMSKLTVLMATADIMMMDSKLASGVRDSLQEIKNEGQSLLDLIKSYTIPPDAPKSH